MDAMDGPMVGRPVIQPKPRSKAMKTTVALRNISLIALLGAALAAPVLAQTGPGGRAMRFDQNNTRGWTLMTPEERTVHRDKMLSLKNYEECKSFQTEHRSAMEVRAKEKGVTLPDAPPAMGGGQGRGMVGVGGMGPGPGRGANR